MDSRPANPKHARNKNVLVVGGSGSGKKRCFVKANLMQCQSAKHPASFVVTDPKGELLRGCGKMLARHGYRIKVLDTADFAKSMHYNPLDYIRSEKDILKLVTALIANTKGDGRDSEDFWVKSESLLYCALIGFIWYEAPPEERNMNTLVGLINSMEVREDDESHKNFVDHMFDELEAAEPDHFAVRQYKKYKLAAGLISCKWHCILMPNNRAKQPFAAQVDACQREKTGYERNKLPTLMTLKSSGYFFQNLFEKGSVLPPQFLLLVEGVIRK